MPSDYLFWCPACNWAGMRYRNVKVCPKCKGKLKRFVEAPVKPFVKEVR